MWITVIIFSFLLIGPSQAKNDGKCKIKGIDSDTSWNIVFEPVGTHYDNKNDVNIFVGAYEKPLNNLKCQCSDKGKYDYITFTTNDTDFIISTSDYMTKLDENTEKTKNNKTTIQIPYTCTMTCSGDSSLTIYTTITDYNNHYPEFSEESGYTYKVSSPLMPKTNFLADQTLIKVTDLDFSNQNVAFKIEPDHFDITTAVDTNDNKTYIAVIRAKQPVILNETTSYMITATDFGSYPKQLSRTVPITLQVDETVSWDIPEFSSATYNFRYNDDASLTPLSGIITLKTKKPDSVTNIQLLGDYKDYFSVSKMDSNTKTFDLTIKKNILNPTTSSTFLTLSVTTDMQVSVPIIITFSGVKGQLYFDKNSYTATYNDVDSIVKLDQNIVVVSSGIPTVKVSGDLSKHFTVKLDETSLACTISVKEPLSVDEIKSNLYINLLLTATLDANSATANLIIKIPTYSLQFTQALYTATYNENDSVTMGKTPIAFVTTESKVNISVDNAYSKYFKIDDDKTIKVLQALPSNIKLSQAKLPVILTAIDSYKNQARAVVEISLPLQDIIQAPKFSKLYYTIKYKNEQTGYIEFEDSIAFDNVADSSTLNISLSDYNSNFDVTYNETEKKWQVYIKTPLTSDVFDSNSQLITTMEASETGVSEKGKATLVIELLASDSSKGPQYSDLYYVTKYIEGQTGYIDFETDISFKNVKDLKTVTITLNDYNSNFDVTYNETEKKWQVYIKTPLTSDVFDSNSQLITTMEASETGVSEKGKATLVIEIIASDSSKGPQYSDLYYVTKYIEGQTGYIDFETDISFKNVKDLNTVTITLNDYNSNFDVTYNETEKKWQVYIKTPLTSDVFDSNSQLITTMEALETGVSEKGKATLVIELIASDSSKGPQYSDLYYVTKYIEGQTGYIDFKKDISFKNVKDLNTVTITLNDYNSNFDVTYNETEKKWQVYIKTPLTSDVFDSNSQLITTMEASETGVSEKGKATLVIEIIASDSSKGPQYSDLYYVTKYIEGQTGYIDFETDISFKNVKDLNTVTITLNDYNSNFDVTYNETEKKWQVYIKTPLTSDVFDSNSQLITTMEASETGVSEKGKATLVIELLASDSSKGPQYSDLYYVTKYIEGQTGYIDFETDISFKNVKDLKTVTITLNDYNSNFDVTYNETEKKWQVYIKTPLTSDVFDSNSQLITTMEALETGVSEKGKATLVIELIASDSSKGPQYSDLFYVTKYIEGQTGYIDFEKDISFKNVKDLNTVTITLDDYSDYFAVVYDSDNKKWKIQIIKPLESSVFDKTTEIIVIMEASLNTAKGKSVLVIKLVDDSVDVTFNDAYYTAAYPEDGKRVTPFDQNISFSDVVDVTKIGININGFTDNFKVEYESTSKLWQIKIMKPLNDTILSNRYITTTLSATIEGNKKFTPVTAFVLKLPEKISPVFSKSYYNAEYTIDGSTTTVSMIDNIEFSTGINVENIKITSDEYSNYFSFDYKKTSKTWQIKTEGILDLNTLSRTDLVVAITANDITSNLTDQAVIDLKLPKVNTADAPAFSKTYYTAKYQITGDKSTVKLNEPLNIVNRESLSHISITTDKYTENFQIMLDGSEWVINVTKNLDQSIINSKVDLVMGLTVVDDINPKEVGLAALVITLPVVNNKEAPKFSSIFYETECNSANTVLNTKINITNKDDFSKIHINILEDAYRSNFQINFDDKTKSWLITVVTLPGDFAKTKKDLVLTLTAAEDNNNDIGQAALILTYPVSTAPIFSSNQYYGNYTEDDFPKLAIDEVVITNKDDQSGITLAIISNDGDFSKNFDYKFDSSKKVWKIELQNPLNTKEIQGKSEIILTLSATEKDNDNVGYTTIIIYLLNNEDVGLSFSQVYYEGYYKTGSTDTLSLDKSIKLVSTNDLSAANVVFQISDSDLVDPNKYFAIKSSNSPGTYNIDIVEKLPTDILNDKKVLIFTLEASLDTSKSFATLVINLPSSGAESSIEFSKILYDGKYEFSVTNSKRTFSVDEISLIIPEEDTSTIEVKISKDSQYGSYFKVSRTDSIVTLEVSELPTSILKKITLIPLTLIASSKTSLSGSAVVNINIDYVQGSVEFESTLINGKYEIKDKIHAITVDPILLKTDQLDDDVSVIIKNAYKDYFSVSYSDLKVTLTKEKDIPSKDLADLTTVSILLTASIRNSDVKSNAVVSLRLINDDNPAPDVAGVLQFDSLINTAQYSVENGKGILKLDAKISLTTDRLENEIEINIKKDSEYRDYFTISYANKLASVSLNKNIPDNVFHTKTFISLTLEANIKKSSISTSAVLNIQLNNDGINTGYLSFANDIFNGNYTVSNNKASIAYDIISVDTDQKDDDINVSVQAPYDEFFEALYTNKIINLNQNNTKAVDILRNLTNFPLVIIARIKDTSHVANTVVNFKVVDTDNGGNNIGSVKFPHLIYSTKYDMDNQQFNKYVISIITDYTDDEIDVEMSNEYNYDDYFYWEYSHSQITVLLKKAIPDDDNFAKVNVIALSLKAFVKNKRTIYGEAVLNIDVQHEKSNLKSTSQTGYIAAISAMSVIIFILIAGIVAFYFLKFRNKKYNKMTEDEYINNNKVKFDKGSMKQHDKGKRSSALDERRPTGFIFHPNADEFDQEPRDSSTDPPETQERKKSVAFDVNVEKLQMEAINDDDIDKGLSDSKNEN